MRRVSLQPQLLPNQRRRGARSPSRHAPDACDAQGICVVPTATEPTESKTLASLSPLPFGFCQIPEQALVRDVIFACQGINGQYIAFDPAQDRHALLTHEVQGIVVATLSHLTV